MKITVIGTDTVTAEYDREKPLSDILSELGFSFDFPCGRNHRCGKCTVRVSGAVSAPTPEERSLLAGHGPEERLACAVTVTGDCTVFLPQSGTAQIMTEGASAAFPKNDAVGIGFAVDVGTTTTAVCCYDLKSGALIGSDAFLNPQRIFGADVISRIEAARNGHAEELKKLITEGITSSVRTICTRHGIDPQTVVRSVITGNTTMLYLLCGIDVSCLAAAPFRITERLGITLPAERLGLNGFPEMQVYLPPVISAFIGADITCAMLHLLRPEYNGSAMLLLDVGTNGEMVLMQNGRAICCSTAAGPAFEGAGISCGCIARDGAVNAVRAENGQLVFSTVNGAAPCGICGSGLLDAVAALLRLKKIDPTGRICPDGEASVPVAPGVALTQADIRAVQLAKSAVCAGVESLLNEAGLFPEKVDCLLFAGGFGSYLRSESAVEIGLFPSSLADRSRAIGNAAGTGAAAMLLSEDAVRAGEELARNAEELALSSSVYFMDRYIENMMFSL